MTLEQQLNAFFEQEEHRKTQIGKLPAGASTEDITQENVEFEKAQNVYDTAIMNTIAGADRGPWAEAVGEAAWMFADEYTLGGLGMAEEYDWLNITDKDILTSARDVIQGGKFLVDPNTGEKFRPGPETFAGKLGGGVGTVGGFIYGAPQKY